MALWPSINSGNRLNSYLSLLYISLRSPEKYIHLSVRMGGAGKSGLKQKQAGKVVLTRLSVSVWGVEGSVFGAVVGQQFQVGDTAGKQSVEAGGNVNLANAKLIDVAGVVRVEGNSRPPH